jgi:glutamate formiminotransferase
MNVIECVPNVSEGRRSELLHEWADELRAVPTLALLDYSGDPCHHRAVFTFAGPATAVRDGVMRLAAKAIAAIDLRTHRGQHPRIGALDVVPFIPLGRTSMAECVVLARDVGRDLAARFELPVFLYEDASQRPDRRRLQDIRRGEFEGLPQKLTTPLWHPDFGPAAPHPTAGAVAVGARRPLIAFNVNLTTPRVDIARRIARVVRESSGGLPAVKALGLFLEDRNLAQVSMNLTDYQRTSVVAAFDAVVAAAAREGTAVSESELIGLIPAAALAGITPERVALRRFDTRRILEVRLREHGIEIDA